MDRWRSDLGGPAVGGVARGRRRLVAWGITRSLGRSRTRRHEPTSAHPSPPPRIGRKSEAVGRDGGRRSKPARPPSSRRRTFARGCASRFWRSIGPDDENGGGRGSLANHGPRAGGTRGAWPSRLPYSVVRERTTATRALLPNSRGAPSPDPALRDRGVLLGLTSNRPRWRSLAGDDRDRDRGRPTRPLDLSRSSKGKESR